MSRVGKTTLAVGHVTHDVYANGVRAGGSAFFGAQASRALGARARLVSAVGDDFERYGELLGLDVHLTVEGSTTTFENSYRGLARSQRIAAVCRPVTPEALPEPWRQADVLFLAPVIGEVEPRVWLDAIDAPVIGLGLQGILKRPGAASRRMRSVARRPFDLCSSVLERLGAVFLSDRDIGEFGSADLLARLRRSVPLVIVTRGAEGAILFHRRTECRVGAFPAFEKDPTGAGDVFASVFLLALAEGADAREAARLGSAAGSIAVEAEGGSSLERVCESRSRAPLVSVTEIGALSSSSCFESRGVLGKPPCEKETRRRTSRRRTKASPRRTTP